MSMGITCRLYFAFMLHCYVWSGCGYHLQTVLCCVGLLCLDLCAAVSTMPWLYNYAYHMQAVLCCFALLHAVLWSVS